MKRSKEEKRRRAAIAQTLLVWTDWLPPGEELRQEDVDRALESLVEHEEHLDELREQLLLALSFEGDLTELVEDAAIPDRAMRQLFSALEAQIVSAQTGEPPKLAPQGGFRGAAGPYQRRGGR